MATEDVSVVRVELTEGLDSTNSTLIASSSIVNEPPLPQTAATDGGDIVMVDSDLTAKSSAQAAAAPNHPHPPWLIDPRKSKFIGYWDLVTGLALLFTAIVTPWEVAFAKPPTTALESMFLFNRFIDSIFVFDMGIQFCLIYQVGSTGSLGSRWEDDPRVIAKHYLGSWFCLDVVSILPFDVLSIVASKAFANLKIFRLFRLMRLIKLVRLIRASRMFKRWESRMSVSYGTLALIKSLVLVCIGAHWFACTWAIQAGLLFDSPLETWMGYQGYCVPVNISLLPESTQEDHAGYECADAWVMYTASLYFAVMTITSIGYGDIHATPQNAPEQGVALILMLTGAMVWAHVIATFAGVVATLNPDQTDFRRTMDALNRFMGAQSFPPEMQRRLREYFHESQHLQDSVTRQRLLSKMSPQLAGEVALKCNAKWLKRVWFLENAGQDFVVQIALHLQAVVLTIGEVASSGFLYIINRGLALYGGRVLLAGSVWGEDMILESEWLLTKYCARAMTYLEVFTISRSQLMAVTQYFPETARHIRRCTIRLATRRSFIAIANERKLASMTSDSNPLQRRESVVDRIFESASSAVSSPGVAHVHANIRKTAMNQSLSKPEPDSQKMVSRRRSSFSGSLPLLCPLPPNEPVSNTPAAEHRTKPSAVGLLSTADGQQRESSGTEISFDADEPSSQALAAQLARLETQQAQMTEQMASLQTGMETLLRLSAGSA